MATSARVFWSSSPWSWLGATASVLAGRSAWRRWTPAPAAVALLCAGVLPAAAQSPPQVLFQSSYERSGGQSDVYQDAFSTCDPTGSYRLVLDNGIDGAKRVSGGSVLVNGVKVLDIQKSAAQIVRTVTLRPANGVEVRLSGPKGGRVRVTVDGSPRCLGVRFTAPLAGSVIAQPDTLVEGEIEAPGAAGVKLRVSYPTPGGAPVELFVASETNGGRFAAWLPLAPGALTVTALAADAAGRSGEGAISFTFSPAAPGDERATRPDVSPTTGFAPLTVTFGCGAAADPEADLVELDVDGDGVTDFDRDDCAAPPHQVTYTYFSEGLHLTTLLTRDVAGQTHVQRVPINVVPAPDLPALWDAFRTALGSGDIDAALWFIAFEAQARYRRALQDLQPDLAAIAAGLQGLTPLVVTSEYATAATTRILAGVTELFLVSFIRDGDGMWRIASF
jgi:hypothetical protein